MRKNPFLENIQVVGEGYIGRHETISYIKRILSKNSRDGGVVISGLTRMGKTSLVKKCFKDAETEGLLKENHIVAFELTISTIQDFSVFLMNLTDEISDILEEQEYLDYKFERLFQEASKARKIKKSERIYEQDKVIKRIFKHLKKMGIKAVILLDEFDDAGRMFCFHGDDLSTNFQKFRDYASEADYNVTFILTSRISISQIDASLPSGSNLRGVFSEKVLVGFTDKEREEFFEKIKECGVPLTDQQKEEVVWYAGRSPFLFSKLACGILNTDEKIDCRSISVRDVFVDCKNDFNDYFDALINFMKREDLYSKMVQLFFGPAYDFTNIDIEKLKDAGYIYHSVFEKNFKDAGYIRDGEDLPDDAFTHQTLSEYFIEYLRLRSNQDNSLKIWSELIDAENELRIIVEQGLQNEFGILEWKNKLQSMARSGERGYLYDANKAIAFIRNSQNNFGDVVEDNPLTVISIKSLGNIIKAFWKEQYEKVFKQVYSEQQILLEELNQLNRARNPLAHGKPEYLSSSDKENISKYCRKIVNIRRSRRH